MSKSSTTLSGIKAASSARQHEEDKRAERKRSCLVLAMAYLANEGYRSAAEKAAQESGLSLDKYTTADNMDLSTILVDFESYYEMRFGRKPRFVKKIAEADAGANSARSRSSGRHSARASNPLPNIPASMRRSTSSDAIAAPAAASKGPPSVAGVGGATSTTAGTAATMGRPPSGDSRRRAAPAASALEGKDAAAMGEMGLTTAPVAASSGPKGRSLPGSRKEAAEKGEDEDDREAYFERRVMKPMPDFGMNLELRDLAAWITRDIYTENPNVRWNDIAGNEECKRVLKEAVIMPIKYPQLFQGLLSPWKGLLLFGPPGTGKTMLAKAVATECNTTFFNISASTIVSKYRGDSEKLVRVLFELARYHAPSTIFLDELDAIMGQRSADGNEHEGSRRMKTELLMQMDGLAKSDDLVFVLAATNLPWILDQALLRRLEKRIYVPLPEAPARKAIFANLFENVRLDPAIDLNDLADRTAGFSGSDIWLLCKEAAMHPLRRIMSRLEADEDIPPDDDRLVLSPITATDMAQSLEKTKPTATQFLAKYNEWMQNHGAL